MPFHPCSQSTNRNIRRIRACSFTGSLLVLLQRNPVRPVSRPLSAVWGWKVVKKRTRVVNLHGQISLRPRQLRLG
ncbi:hypothetical protein BS47DRAFT_1487077 [Hydnum rufescens UP504]|uniref:Uncharacterized protein n=1 Tax=Hydnum rufescens UP504 TaxID=1448309 RepID=A0A9P6DQI0_9AGAM|nr:hypothetical protein BS47DRAFT_1487077 [Hydnum rufescens UP504]